MSTPIRAGFIGGGFMAAVHTRASRAARAQLVALAGSTADTGADAAVRLGVGRSEPDAGRLAGASDIDVVHVCSPNGLHYEQTLAVLAAGRHVICEKPLAITVSEAEEMTDAAARAGVVAAVPFVYRYHPMVRHARAMVAAGEVGTVLTLDAAYLQDWLLQSRDQNWRTDSDAGGASRAFADIGSHLCDLVEFVTGQRIVRLTARTRTVHTQRAGLSVSNEDIAALIVEMSDGALGTLLISQLAPGRKNGLVLELHGTVQSLRFAQERPEELWIGRRHGSQLALRDGDADAADAARLSVLPAGHALGYQDAFTAFVADVYAAIRAEGSGSAPPDGLPVFADGLRAAVLTHAVLTSAATGGLWVDTP